MKAAGKIIVLSSIILLLFLFTTDPQKLPSVLLVAPFILLFTIIASIVPLILSAHRFPAQVVFKISMTVAAVPVLLLVLQSLGQLTVRDVLAVIALFGVAYFYMSRFGVRVAN